MLDYKLKYGFTYGEVLQASREGNVHYFEWFKNSGYEFKYDNRVIYYASMFGNVEILEWFKNYVYEFKYDEYAIQFASETGEIEVLKWFKNSGYKFKYNKDAIYLASIKSLKFLIENINIKKIVCWKRKRKSIKKSSSDYNKTIKIKTKNNYIKGYNKN